MGVNITKRGHFQVLQHLRKIAFIGFVYYQQRNLPDRICTGQVDQYIFPFTIGLNNPASEINGRNSYFEKILRFFSLFFIPM